MKYLYRSAMLLLALFVLALPVTAKNAKPSLSKTKLSMTEGQKKKLTVKNRPAGAKVTWSSKKKSVATVNKKGVVKAKKAGNTTIVCKVKARGKTTTLKCAVKVKAKKPSGKYKTTDLTFMRDGQKIAGRFYTPDGKGKFPTVILCHGFKGNMSQSEYYAEYMAKNGFAACIFDFIGGGTDIQSDGEMTEMSVLTEAADLEVVFSEVKKMDCVDTKNIFLAGGSQGGFVATYVAAKEEESVRGLVALYPAYAIHDYVKLRMESPDYDPENESLLGARVGKIYFDDAASFDIYDMIKDFDKPVLIMHGDDDRVIPLVYSQKAQTTFPNAALSVYKGADHGFVNPADAQQRSAKEALAFAKKVMNASK